MFILLLLFLFVLNYFRWLHVEFLDSSALKLLENFDRLSQNRIMKWTLLGRKAETDIKDDFSVLSGLYGKNHDELPENTLLMWCNKVSLLSSFQIMTYFILNIVWNIALTLFFSTRELYLISYPAFSICFNNSYFVNEALFMLLFHF